MCVIIMCTCNFEWVDLVVALFAAGCEVTSGRRPGNEARL